MSRPPTPTDKDLELQQILKQLEQYPQTVRELVENTGLARKTVENKLAKARDLRLASRIQFPGTSPIESKLWCSNPLISKKPDDSISPKHWQRYVIVLTFFAADFSTFESKVLPNFNKKLRTTRNSRQDTKTANPDRVRIESWIPTIKEYNGRLGTIDRYLTDNLASDNLYWIILDKLPEEDPDIEATSLQIGEGCFTYLS